MRKSEKTGLLHRKVLIPDIFGCFSDVSFSDRFSEKPSKIRHCPKNRTVWQHWTLSKIACMNARTCYHATIANANPTTEVCVHRSSSQMKSEKRSGNGFSHTRAQGSYVNENVSKALGLKQEGSDRISLATFGATHRSVKECPVVNVYIDQKNGELASIQANVINNISCPLQKVHLSTAKHSSLQKPILVEPLCNTPEAMPIDILIWS